MVKINDIKTIENFCFDVCKEKRNFDLGAINKTKANPTHLPMPQNALKVGDLEIDSLSETKENSQPKRPDKNIGPINKSDPFLCQGCPVSWGCRIHRLHLCRGVRHLANECPGYETKQSDGEVPVMLELWGMQSTPLLPCLPGPLWPGVVAPDRVLFMA